MASNTYGFSVELPGITGSKNYGFVVELLTQLKVLVTNGGGTPLAGQTVQLLYGGVLVNQSVTNSSGVALISILDTGAHEIKTISSDRKQIVTYAGVNLNTTYIVFGINLKYKVKAIKIDTLGSNYTNTVEINI